MSPRKIHAVSLCGDDYSYLLGLYFTDGCLAEGRKLFFSLQEDETGFIDRAVELLRGMGLHARVKRSWNSQRGVTVSGCACDMGAILPSKEDLLSGDSEGFRSFFSERGLLAKGSKLMAFLGGLLDGDGDCIVKVRFRTRQKDLGVSQGSVESRWEMVSTSYPILAYYFPFAVRCLVGGEASLRVARDDKGKRVAYCHTVYVFTKGVIRLLNLGFASHSWKVRRWSEKYNELRFLQKKRRLYSLARVRRLLGVSKYVCVYLFELGLLGGFKQVYPRGRWGSTVKYFFSGEEFNVLRERKEEILLQYAKLRKRGATGYS